MFLSSRQSHFIQQVHFSSRHIFVFADDSARYWWHHEAYGLEREFLGGSQPVRKSKNIGLLEGKVPMFCLENTEVCLKEVRCFLFPKPILLLPPKKSFQKKTYISYTNPWEPLYLLGFSGEGLGVGFGAGVGWILHFPYCSPCFCLFFAPNIRHFFVIPCRI